MLRRCAAALALTLVTTGVGCRMCQDCYDYAGPIVEPGVGPIMGFHDRRNGIAQGYGGGGQVVYEGDMMPQEPPVNQGAAMHPGMPTYQQAPIMQGATMQGTPMYQGGPQGSQSYSRPQGSLQPIPMSQPTQLGSPVMQRRVTYGMSGMQYR